MSRPLTMTALLLTLTAATARGEHAKIELTVRAGDAQEAAHMDQTPPDSGKNPRPIVKAKVGAPIKVEWMFVNVYPHRTLKDVVLHLYIAREEKVGQKAMPELGDDVVLETAFDMDFRPGGKAGGRHTVRIDTPGVYLVRVESRGTGSDHEHFAALDLVVEGEAP